MSNVASRVRCSLFLLPLLLAPGCAAFRAQVGLGFGVGADVQVLGLQHVGVLLGKYHEWGPNYGRGTYSKTGYTVLGPYHSTHMTFDEDEVTGTTRPPIEHGCYGFFPGPAGLLSDEPAAERWALEFGVAMTFVELRFGFNPVAPIFNVEEHPAGPRPAPAPTPAPRPTQPAAAEGPTASSGAPTHEPGQRTYGGEARETAAPPPPPPPPPAPPPGKQAPPAPANEAPSAAESASQDVRLPDPPSEEHEEAPAEVQEEAPPAPAPSDER